MVAARSVGESLLGGVGLLLLAQRAQEGRLVAEGGADGEHGRGAAKQLGQQQHLGEGRVNAQRRKLLSEGREDAALSVGHGSERVQRAQGVRDDVRLRR
eukprot:5193785-Pleurochrysis_carterae.AAC.1